MKKTKDIKGVGFCLSKQPEKCVDVEIRLTINGRVWSFIQWKKLTPKNFLKLSDFIEDINF